MQMPVRDILAEKGDQCFSVSPQTSVADAVRQMNRRNIGSLLVVENEQLLGIFTERDVLMRVVDAGRDPVTTPVRDTMTLHPVTIGLDTTVEEAMRKVTHHRCRHLPVVVNGRIRGMVSIGDLTRWLVMDREHEIDNLRHYIAGSLGP